MRANFTGVRLIVGMWMLGTALLVAAAGSRAQQAAAVTISVKDHHFQPAELHAPANQPLTLRVRNLDATPMEFESVSLRVEKVVVAGGEGVMNVRPLAPGRYEFFDDFHQETRGTIVVQ
jgi:Cupredoxin-like domain